MKLFRLYVRKEDTHKSSQSKNNLQIMYYNAIFKTSYAGALTYKVRRSGWIAQNDT